ncbi:MAG: DNA alkylation repair protein [Solidesulfovibrio sp. DCME]|uniref:DNA alkylation repair protein n=1 Tax=Solidesulfovibrio sp. DCME TaxID=3447380 RepID=UPI003D0AF700
MGTNSRCPGRPAPFVKRAGLTCLASLAVHDKAADEAVFRADLAAVAAVAADDRQPVRKGASWVLRQIGKRSESLRQAALDTARGLLARGEPAARFAAREALRELTRPPAADKRAAARQGLA